MIHLKYNERAEIKIEIKFQLDFSKTIKYSRKKRVIIVKDLKIQAFLINKGDTFLLARLSNI